MFKDFLPGDVEFLSTLPARGATQSVRLCHAPHHLISIHAPREGSDLSSISMMVLSAIFLSTLPARGATSLCGIFTLRNHISIHAPREGSDLRPCRACSDWYDFYPRSPRGERLRHGD